jgi:spermidine synthase
MVIEALPVYRYLYEYAYNNLGFYGLSVARLLLSMIVLLPPVLLIGGTMPLLAKYFLRDPANLGSSFSKIYYLNTLGACAGALLTGFVFVRFFGVIGTLMIAVGGNLLVALIIALSKRGTVSTHAATGEKSSYSYMLVFLFLTGSPALSAWVTKCCGCASSRPTGCRHPKLSRSSSRGSCWGSQSGPGSWRERWIAAAISRPGSAPCPS